MHRAFVAVHMGFLSLWRGGEYPLAAARELLTVVVSLVTEHRLYATQASVVAAPRLWSTGSVVVVHGLRCPMARGIFHNQGLNA